MISTSAAFPQKGQVAVSELQSTKSTKSNDQSKTAPGASRKQEKEVMSLQSR